MKRTLFTITVCLLFICAASAQTPRTQICDFDGENDSKVYSLVTMT
jgi:hypothetical protein